MAVLYRRTINSPLVNSGLTNTFSPFAGTNYDWGTVYSHNTFNTGVTGLNADQQRADNITHQLYREATGSYNYGRSSIVGDFMVPTAPKYDVNRDYGWSTADQMREQNIARQTGRLNPITHSTLGYSGIIPTQAQAMDIIARGGGVKKDGRSATGYTSYKANDIYYALAGIEPPARNFNFFSQDRSDPTSPFSNTRYNMLGGMETISRSDPRHTASMYEKRSPLEYGQYTSGAINGRQLFQAGLNWADRDEIQGTWKPSQPQTVTVRFGSSGGGSYFGTGVSFTGLSGKRFW